MRVLHIIDSGGMYGAEMMLLNLVEEQIKQGGSPKIASIGALGLGEKPFEIEARKRGFSIKAFRMRPGLNFLGAFKVLQYAKSEECTLLHSHGFKGNVLFGCIPKKIRHLPLLTTLHGWASSRTRFTKLRLYEWLDLQMLSSKDAVVLVNEGMLSHPQLAEKKNIKFYVVNNGISLEEPEVYPCAKLGLETKQDLNIVAVGRLSPEKGFDVLLNALARVVEKGGDVSLVLFGEGRQRHKLEDLVSQLGLGQRVKMPGFLSNVAATFPCFDILVMPSLSEGLPITLLEAMRAKLPMIASRVGGIPNVLQDGANGVLVEPKDVEELSEAICDLLGSKVKRTQLVEKAHLLFKHRYSSVKMAKDYQLIYADILANK